MGKFLRGLLIMGAAVAVSLGASSFSAEASSINTEYVGIDYHMQKLHIEQQGGTRDTKFYMAKATVTTNKKTGVVTLKTAAATEYETVKAGVVTIDLSTFAVTKDNYISIWGNRNTDPILIRLPATVTKMKATVNALDTTVKVENITDKSNPIDITDYMEYCTANGEWKNYGQVNGAAELEPSEDRNGDGYADLDIYANLGATLRFRLRATGGCTIQDGMGVIGEYEPTVLGKDKDGNTVSVYAPPAFLESDFFVGNFASNEIKVKIPKTAAGPKATIDYNLRIIKVPINSEFRKASLNQDDVDLWDSSFVKAVDAASVYPDVTVTIKSNVATIPVDGLFEVGVGAGDTVCEFDLRTAADVVKKKPASKITEYQLRGVGTPVAIASDGGVVGSQYGDATIDNAAIGAEVNLESYNNPYVKFHSFVYGGKTKYLKAIKLENLLKGSMDKYQVVVSFDSKIPDMSTKVNATLNPGRITQIPAYGGEYVYIRKVGNAKEKIWSTPYVFLGKVPEIYPEE